MSKKSRVVKQPVVPAHEINETCGSYVHRVVIGDAAGEWVGWRGIATVVHRGVTYAAVTPYYAGTLPIGQVFVVRPTQSITTITSS